MEDLILILIITVPLIISGIYNLIKGDNNLALVSFLASALFLWVML
jgi:hypothetical protein